MNKKPLDGIFSGSQKEAILDCKMVAIYNISLKYIDI